MRDGLLAGLAPARRRLLLVVLGLLGLVVVAGTLSYAVTRLRSEDRADQSRPGPVLVVPGYGGGTHSVDPLVAELRGRGRTVVEFRPTQGGTGDLRVQARRLAGLARRTMASAGASSVDVVGYSAGGVIARLYVRDEGGASVVRRVLTIGSPHHGSDVAALAGEVAGCPRACEQLMTGSDLLRALNAGDETPDGPRWVTIRTDDDEVVTPSVSARLAGALNLRVQAFCASAATTHAELPGDPVVLATVSSTLGVGPPKAPTDVSC